MSGRVKVEVRWKDQPADEEATCAVCGEGFSIDGHEIESRGRRVLCLPCAFGIGERRRRTEYGREPGDVNPFGWRRKDSDRLAYGPIGAGFRQACTVLKYLKEAIRDAKARR